MNKILIAYFSHAGENYYDGGLRNLKVGNAKKIAEKVKNLIDADMFEIETIKAYPYTYKACCDQALEEQRRGKFPELKRNLENAEQYEKMILIYPCWWGTMPQAVFTFLKANNFADIEIYPICTHEGSGLGRSETDLKKYSAKVSKGLAVQGPFADRCDENLKNWLENNKIL